MFINIQPSKKVGSSIQISLAFLPHATGQKSHYRQQQRTGPPPPPPSAHSSSSSGQP